MPTCQPQRLIACSALHDGGSIARLACTEGGDLPYSVRIEGSGVQFLSTRPGWSQARAVAITSIPSARLGAGQAPAETESAEARFLDIHPAGLRTVATPGPGRHPGARTRPGGAVQPGESAARH